MHIAVTQTVAHTGLTGADTPSQIASPGVTFSNSTVAIGAKSATVTIKTTLDNLSSSPQSLSVNAYLIDANGVIQVQKITTQTLSAGQTGFTLTQTATINNPHLWNGRIDPYLYTLNVEIRQATTWKVFDVLSQKVGIRTIKINANPQPNGSDPGNVAAVMLNGEPYRIVGVDMHQDSGMLDASGQPVGYAQTDAQIRAAIDLVAQMGATAIRTSHYQDNQAFYDYCDELGILVDTEAPIKTGAANDAFTINAEDQFNELVRQNINHPSVFAWGFGNEVDNSSNTLFNLFMQFESIAHTLDPNRVTVLADYGGSKPSYNSNGTPSNLDAIADILDTHPYTYWYGGSSPGVSQNSKQPQGVGEYGGGGSAYQYADSFTLPVDTETGGVTTHFHPQNQQEQLEERQYTDLTTQTYLWGQFTWEMFDNASPGDAQGDQNGVNDKGLVTRDGVKKDSYYFYQAVLNDPTRTWDNTRVLKLGDQFWTTRNSSSATVTVYSNIGAPTLVLNGVSLGAMSQLSLGTTGLIPDTYTMNITLATGSNKVQVNRAYSDGQNYSDSAVWTYRNSLSGTSVAKIDFIASGTAATGYAADTGATYGVRSNGQTYGWLAASGSSTAFGSTLGVGSSFGGASAASTSASATGFNLNYNATYKTSSIWQYKLPNGVYDIQIGAGQSGTSDGVDMFTLQGKTAAIDSNGNNTQDVFYSRVTVTNGLLTLAAAPGAFNTRIDYININSVTDTTAPAVTNVTVNGGDAQRSIIDSLSTTFTKPVTLQSNALSLSMRGGATYAITSANPSGDAMTYTLSLTNGSSLATLPDGVYDLTFDNTKIADTVSGIAMAAPLTFTFHRLFGDVNGDRRVDALDTLTFNLAQGSTSSQSNYQADLDYNGDGVINTLDALKFKKNTGYSLTY